MARITMCLLVVLSWGAGVYAGPTIEPPTIISIDDNKNTSFSVQLVSVVGTTWTYEVKELSGRDLSHWNLGIPCVINDIDSANPSSGFSTGIDGSTGFHGIKWDVKDNFDSGLFSITLGSVHDYAWVDALVKAGRGSAVGKVIGPVCNDRTPRIPVPGALVLAGVGLSCVSYLQRRRMA